MPSKPMPRTGPRPAADQQGVRRVLVGRVLVRGQELVGVDADGNKGALWRWDMRQLFMLVAVILLSTLGCTSAVETSGQVIDLEAERTLLLETDRTQAEAYSTSDTPLDTIFASFADDARVLAPGMPMAEGWEASRAVFAELEALPGYSLEYSPGIADVGAGADLGYTIGTYHTV